MTQAPPGFAGNRTALAIGLLSLVGLLCSLLDYWLLFGFVSLALLVSALAVGFGRHGRRKPVLYTLVGVFFIYSALLAAIVWTYQSEGEPTLLLGFPVSTALLVYGIWPLGFIPGILYLLIFETSVLRREKLQDFMAKFGTRVTGSLMPIAESPIVILCVVAYLVACSGIGVWAMRRTHSIADFLVAGRTLGPIVLVIAAMSSIMSGFGFVGGPGLVFESGSSSLWITFSAPFGFALSWILVGKRLRLLAAAREILTLPDAVAARYGGRWPRFMMALAILLGVVGYLGTQVLAIGMVLVAVLGVKLPVALLIGLGVLAFYSVAGGIFAGVYTDLFQGTLMIVASLVVFYYALQAGGGMSRISATLWEMNPEFISVWGSRGPLTALSWYLLFALGNVGQPHAITKFLMLRDIRQVEMGRLDDRLLLRAAELALDEYRSRDARPGRAGRPKPAGVA